MTTCPHCGQPVRDEYKLCPFCGTDVVTGKRSGKGAATNDPADATAGTVGCVLTGLIYYVCGAGYFVSGNILWEARHSHEYGNVARILAQRQELMWLGFGLPVLLTGLPYLLLRRRFPAAARGLGFVCLTALAIALGAPFLCSR